MFETIDEISMKYEEDGLEVVQELDKEILTRGAWTTILFKYQDWDRKENAYGAPKFSIRRYKKFNNAYREQSKFNVSSVEQAEKIIATLQRWIAEIKTQPE